MSGGGVRKTVALTITVGIGLVSTVFGQSTTEFGVYGPGPGGPNLAGVYTDPYVGYYNSGLTGLGSATSSSPNYSTQLWTSSSSTRVAAFCDDFANEIDPPQYWNAYDTNLGSLPTTTPPLYYGGTSGSAYTTSQWNPTIYNSASGTSGSGAALGTQTFSQTADYIAVAYLAYESQNDTGDTTAQEIYSFALWAVFDPRLLQSATNSYGTMSQTDLDTARTDLAKALGVGEYYAGLSANTAQQNGAQQFESALGIDVEIYSAVGGSPNNHSSPQEFVTVTPASTQGFGPPTVPEPSSLASLGFDLGGVALLGLVFRRYRAQQSK